MSITIRIGSRDSVLAVIQAQIVMSAVKETNPHIDFELVTIKTTGDKIFDKSLDEIGGKGLFIKELEQALADGSIDIAVHSYKDMPYAETEGLPIVALSKRESPFDALVLPKGKTVMDKSKPVGSSSLRRTLQFRKLYNDFEIKPIRGNVPTRLSKLDNGEYSALILAEAGLNRLSLQPRTEVRQNRGSPLLDRVSRIFTLDEMIPSAGQGILAVQGRKGDDHFYLSGFHNRESEIVSKAERQFLKTLDCGCSAPVAAYAQLHGGEILLTGMFADDNGRMETGKISGSADDAELLGETLAWQLKTRLKEK